MSVLFSETKSGIDIKYQSKHGGLDCLPQTGFEPRYLAREASASIPTPPGRRIKSSSHKIGRGDSLCRATALSERL